MRHRICFFLWNDTRKIFSQANIEIRLIDTAGINLDFCACTGQNISNVVFVTNVKYWNGRHTDVSSTLPHGCTLFLNLSIKKRREGGNTLIAMTQRSTFPTMLSEIFLVQLSFIWFWWKRSASFGKQCFLRNVPSYCIGISFPVESIWDGFYQRGYFETNIFFYLCWFNTISPYRYSLWLMVNIKQFMVNRNHHKTRHMSSQGRCWVTTNWSQSTRNVVVVVLTLI